MVVLGERLTGREPDDSEGEIKVATPVGIDERRGEREGEICWVEEDREIPAPVLLKLYVPEACLEEARLEPRLLEAPELEEPTLRFPSLNLIGTDIRDTPPVTLRVGECVLCVVCCEVCGG